MSFNAHDLKNAFEDGRRFERKRILEILHDKIINDANNGDAGNEYRWYVKQFNQEDHWDIGEI